MGQGQAIDGTGQNGPVSELPGQDRHGGPFDLGTCAGSSAPAYEEVTYYFPEDGQTFNPSDATNACTGE